MSFQDDNDAFIKDRNNEDVIKGYLGQNSLDRIKAAQDWKVVEREYDDAIRYYAGGGTPPPHAGKAMPGEFAKLIESWKYYHAGSVGQRVPPDMDAKTSIQKHLRKRAQQSKDQGFDLQ